jgi:hypothetical protein
MFLRFFGSTSSLVQCVNVFLAIERKSIIASLIGTVTVTCHCFVGMSIYIPQLRSRLQPEVLRRGGPFGDQKSEDGTWRREMAK